MLGLRHYRHAAIDLWQGEVADFVCDSLVHTASQSVFEDANSAGARHLAIAPKLLTHSALESEAHAAIEAARRYLDGPRTKPALQRITFVLSSMPAYDAYQRQLFDQFPEPDL